MVLFSLSSKKEYNKKGPSPTGNATCDEDFEKWCQNSTQASVLKEYLEEFIGDVNYSYSTVEPETLAYFNGLVAGLGIDSNGHISMAPIIEYLKNSEPEHKDVLGLNATILEALIVPHACFPFSHTVPLTRDAFCRAIILLTNRCKTVLGQGSVGATEVILRETSPRQRLFFIFSALVHPSTGEASYDDLLDVVSRLSYPTRVNRSKHMKLHRSRAQLAPLAQRLEPGKPTTVALHPLSVEVLKPLEKLVAVFPPEHLEEGPKSDRSFGDVHEVSVEEFMDWGERVDLLSSLDWVYCVFFTDRYREPSSC